MKTLRIVGWAGTMGLAALSMAAVAGCDDNALLDDCLCTEEFRSEAVTVVDTAGMPVDSMTVEVTRTRDGFAFTPDQGLAFDPGTYVIMDDADKAALSPAGEAVRVVATKGGTSVAGDYIFATDDCLCHIEKVSGPDTLVWGAGG